MASDPWEDPHSEAQRILDENRRLSRELLARRIEFNRIEDLWQKVIAAPRDTEDCLALGLELHRRECEFWIDLALLNLRRLHEAKGIEKPGLAALLRIAVLRLLLASCRQDRTEIETELQKTSESFRQGAVVDAIDDAKSFLSDWMIGAALPATPHITTEELAAALHDLDGFSRANVFRMLGDGRLTTEEPHDDGHCHWVRFRHASTGTQLEMLRALRDYFSKKSEFQAKPKSSQTRKRKSR